MPLSPSKAQGQTALLAFFQRDILLAFSALPPGSPGSRADIMCSWICYSGPDDHRDKRSCFRDSTVVIRDYVLLPAP